MGSVFVLGGFSGREGGRGGGGREMFNAANGYFAIL